MERSLTQDKMKYATRTDGAIKEALLALLAKKQLADITVSELSREAHVSRSTFYEHFGNPADVYDAVVRDYIRTRGEGGTLPRHVPKQT